jgi:tetratricopeptide (TPR) repeat protein
VALWLAGPAVAAGEPAAAESAAAANSAMDKNLFLLLLVGELEAQEGRLGSAHSLILDAANRSRDEGLFERAVELAIQARDGDKALAAAKTWRTAMPESPLALRTQVQLLVALDKPAELSEPLRALIQRQTPNERAATIVSVPRFLASMADKARALAIAEQALAPFAKGDATRTAVRTALGRLALAADQPEAALSQARKALADEPAAPGPALLALDLMPKLEGAEALVQGYLAGTDALPPVRLAYARALDQLQRIGEAAVQVRQALVKEPEQATAWLSLGAYLVDLRENDEAVAALERFLRLDAAASPKAEAASGDEHANRRGMTELAYLLLAQAQDQRGDLATAASWLDRIEPNRLDMSALTRRASLMVQAGRVEQARALVRDTPLRDEPEARTRLLAEAQVLRDARLWQAAYDLLLAALRQAPDDTVLMYEMAMVADRLARFDDMEALLRRVIALKPDDHQAHNALGYSLADRNLRLEEARSLVRRAAELAPHDPFIIDSQGWVAYRLGQREEALKLLRRAHLARPHVEVAAHLGEVLWAMGQEDEARRIWRDGRAREAGNDVLTETLARLKVGL